MLSKFKAKQPKPIENQTQQLKALAVYVAALDRQRASCANCGAKATTSTNRYSKCRYGGTFLRIKPTKEPND